MKIAVYGKGNVGDRLAVPGDDGADVSQADVLLIAVPGDKLTDSLAKLKHSAARPVVDATNLVDTKPSAAFHSNAEWVKSKTDGPTAKSRLELPQSE